MYIDYLMSIKEINHDFLLKVILDIANYDIFKSGSDFYHTEVNQKGDIKSFTEDTKKAIDEFFTNSDHGYAHSINVYERSKEIIGLIREEDTGFKINKTEYINIQKWAAIFHDISRFYGVSGTKHERVSKEIASNIFYQNAVKEDCYIKSMILLCIEEHDWFNLHISNGIKEVLKRNPIVDIFRLADKTSVPPKEELMRYYETGKRYKTPFFNPELSISDRFDFKNNCKKRDIVTHFLLFFTFNEDCLFFSTTIKLYKKWAKDKEDLKLYITDDLCKDEQLPEEQIEMIRKILKGIRK